MPVNGREGYRAVNGGVTQRAFNPKRPRRLALPARRLNTVACVIDCACHDDPHLHRFCLLSRALIALPAQTGGSLRQNQPGRSCFAQATGVCPAIKRIIMPAYDIGSTRARATRRSHQFIHDGFVRIDRAFSRDICRRRPRHPVAGYGHATRMIRRPGRGRSIRLRDYNRTLRQGRRTRPILHAAFDRLVGKRRWRPCIDPGTFPIRFPSPDDPGDAGWHVDVSFPAERRSA